RAPGSTLPGPRTPGRRLDGPRHPSGRWARQHRPLSAGHADEPIEAGRLLRLLRGPPALRRPRRQHARGVVQRRSPSRAGPRGPDAGPLERVDLYFPPVAVAAFRADDVVRVAATRERLELRDGAELAGPVHGDRPLPVPHAQLDRVAHAAGKLNDVDRARGDGPDLLRLADSTRAVRRL